MVLFPSPINTSLVLRAFLVIKVISSMQTRIIGLSGQSGTGKSHLASELVHALEAEVVSFGSYVRAEALRRGKGIDRATLQELGQVLIDGYGCDTFVQQ